MGDRQRVERPDRKRRRERDDTERSAEREAPAALPSLLDLQALAGNQAVNAAVQARLEVSGVDDSSEREADAVAREVMRRLRTGSGGAADVAAAPGRAVRRAPVPGTGPDGGEIPTDVESRLRSTGGGQPLEAHVRSTMEGAFGADFSAVRVHRDSPLAPTLRAEAFTFGREVHFAPGRYQPATPDGQELLAHELTHVVQQSGAVGRRVQRRMWAVKDFDEETKEGFFTQKATAQKTIATMLDDYHGSYRYEDYLSFDTNKAQSAIERIKQMREAAETYIASKTVTKRDGSTIEDPKRKKRIAGMRRFIALCDGELETFGDLIEKLHAKDRPDLASASTEESEGLKKLKDHYSGSVGPMWTKMGHLIDFSVPNPGDKSKVELEAQVPVHPGVYMGFHLTADAARGDANKDSGAKVKGALVSTGVEVGIFAKGGIANIAEVKGELGGYMKAQAKTGVEVCELFSYAMYRRGRESKVVPDELVSILWGGQASEYGKAKAEEWSYELEERIFGVLGTMPDRSDPTYQGSDGDALYKADEKKFLDEVNAVFVETGGYGSVSGKVGVKNIAELELAIKGFEGTRVDFQSLLRRKGGAGKENLKSDSVFNLTGRAQKRTGRSSRGISIAGKASAGPFAGELGFSFAWLDSGHSKRANEKSSVKLTTAAVELKASGKFPFGNLVMGGVGPYVAELALAIVKAARSAAARADKEAAKEAKTAGAITDTTANGAVAVQSLAQVGKEAWKPDWKLPADPKVGDPTQVGGNAALQIVIAGDFAAGSFGVEINHVKDASIEIPAIFKGSIEKSERVLAIVYEGGSWKVR